MSADKNSGIGLLCQESERLGMESDIKSRTRKLCELNRERLRCCMWIVLDTTVIEAGV